MEDTKEYWFVRYVNIAGVQRTDIALNEATARNWVDDLIEDGNNDGINRYPMILKQVK